MIDAPKLKVPNVPKKRRMKWTVDGTQGRQQGQNEQRL
jgi:hypothetical protein